MTRRSPSNPPRSLRQRMRVENPIRTLLHGIMERGVAVNTAWMLGGQVSKLLLDAALFILLARLLGPTGFGLFVAAYSLVAIATPFAGWGGASVLLMRLSQDPDNESLHFGNSLILLVLSFVVLAPVVVGGGLLVLPSQATVTMLAAILVADLLFKPAVAAVSKLSQAREDLRTTALNLMALPVGRMVGLGAFWYYSSVYDAVTWSYYYAAAHAAVGVLVVGYALVRIRPLRLVWASAWSERGEGLFFSIGLASQTLYADVDKLMLARMVNAASAGLYAAGYRFITVAYAPTRALLGAVASRFFRTGADGIREVLRFTARITRVTAVYGVLASAGLFAAAGLAPLVLGPEYADVPDVIRLIAIVPLLQALYFPLGDAITGVGQQRLRGGGQVLAVGLNLLLNLALIPAYGWRGAAWATIASEGFILLLYGAIATYLVHQERRLHPH